MAHARMCVSTRYIHAHAYVHTQQIQSTAGSGNGHPLYINLPRGRWAHTARTSHTHTHWPTPIRISPGTHTHTHAHAPYAHASRTPPQTRKPAPSSQHGLTISARRAVQCGYRSVSAVWVVGWSDGRSVGGPAFDTAVRAMMIMGTIYTQAAVACTHTMLVRPRSV